MSVCYKCDCCGIIFHDRTPLPIESEYFYVTTKSENLIDICVSCSKEIIEVLDKLIHKEKDISVKNKKEKKEKTKKVEKVLLTYGDAMDILHERYPELDINDIRPDDDYFKPAGLGLTVWLNNGDTFFYYPKEGLWDKEEEKNG